METYKVEFFSFEDLVKDFLSIASMFGRGVIVTAYRYKGKIFTIQPSYELIGIHYITDEENKYPAGEYIFDTITSKVKPKNDKRELSANEMLVVIIDQKYNSLFD
ncbi:MAG: hypothetical protein JRN26_01500 [Nitrososphaerota archaeon]|jgi:hypothetical protein|nr:hypothetical protein [Nitrososphaerota archaeon]MDG6926946.1 hypothetical protein [Nitrososphaerota archaeon]MDG6930502.1 hypothetical protein [Nitrososphaerota archaeon]MDG6932177.1 hypothetical protein [Nitrososphaerota archaeon]MDG6935553.1 hypothetical protein [Nitrososphaerota archaeon]